MELIILALLAFAGYKLFRLRRRSIGEAVRAHIYLERIAHGKAVDDANAFVDAVLHDVRSDVAQFSIRMAQATYEKVHNGNTLAVVGLAYRQGLRPAMPFWYGIGAQMAPVTRAIETTYGRPRPSTGKASIQTAIESQQNGFVTQVGLLDSESSISDYEAYYQSLLFHLKRKNGPSDKHERDVELMVEVFGHDSFREAFRSSIPPDFLADMLIQKLNKGA